ncbi:MAG: hypothetical protein VCC99_01380, partial [Alphaproteobacteria bacterium]
MAIKRHKPEEIVAKLRQVSHPGVTVIPVNQKTEDGRQPGKGPQPSRWATPCIALKAPPGRRN